ncbi:hypothetical protein EIP86_006942 [Pleurotus ostreatoroseus]|nr:hypothetical protein EIP86_006942 [Pleurotus ostreatoroseus]
MILGSTVAIPAAALCVCRQLESAASGRAKQISDVDHRRRKIFECVLCIGGPVLFMLLHCIVQDHRFDIVETIGCRPATFVSVPALFVLWFPPLLLSIIALIYAAIALHHFLRKRLLFEAHVQSTGSSISTQQYLILMALAVTEIVWGSSFTILELSFNVASGLRPWKSWPDTHSDFGRVGRFALDQLSPSAKRELFGLWWSVPAAALIFFAYFVLTEELRYAYGRIFRWLFRKPTKRAESSGSILDLWPDAEGGTKRIIIHKESTIDIYKDGASLPPYSPAVTTQTSFYTAEDVISKIDPNAPSTPAPSTATARPSHRYSMSGSDRTSGTSFSMSILDQLPVSAPSSPPTLERPASQYKEARYGPGIVGEYGRVASPSRSMSSRKQGSDVAPRATTGMETAGTV